MAGPTFGLRVACCGFRVKEHSATTDRQKRIDNYPFINPKSQISDPKSKQSQIRTRLKTGGQDPKSQIEKLATRIDIAFHLLFINYFKNLKEKKEKITKVPKNLSDKECVRQNTGPERRRIKFVGSITCPAKIVENIF
jgi:hypothetical protein